MKWSISNLLQLTSSLVIVGVIVGMNFKTTETIVDRQDKMENQVLLWLNDSEKSQKDMITAINLMQVQLSHLQAFMMKQNPDYVPPSTNPAFYMPDLRQRNRLIK